MNYLEKALENFIKKVIGNRNEFAVNGGRVTYTRLTDARNDAVMKTTTFKKSHNLATEVAEFMFKCILTVSLVSCFLILTVHARPPASARIDIRSKFKNCFFLEV